MKKSRVMISKVWKPIQVCWKKNFLITVFSDNNRATGTWIKFWRWKRRKWRASASCFRKYFASKRKNTSLQGKDFRPERLYVGDLGCFMRSVRCSRFLDWFHASVSTFYGFFGLPCCQILRIEQRKNKRAACRNWQDKNTKNFLVRRHFFNAWNLRWNAVHDRIQVECPHSFIRHPRFYVYFDDDVRFDYQNRLAADSCWLDASIFYRCVCHQNENWICLCWKFQVILNF